MKNHHGTKLGKLINSKIDDNFKTEFERLFIDQKFDLFCYILEKKEQKFQDVILNLYSKIIPEQVQETGSELKEIIRLAIVKNNPIVFEAILTQLISIVKNKSEIRKENFIFIAAKCDKKGDIFEILDREGLVQIDVSNQDEYIETISIALKNENDIFLRKILPNTYTNELTENIKWLELIEMSSKNLECFKVMYEFDKKTCFKNCVLKYCMDNEFVDTFLWILEQLQILIDNNENNELKSLLNKIKANTNDPIFITILEKCKNDDFFTKNAQNIFERIFNLESKVSLNGIGQSCIFPLNSDRSILKKIETECIDIILVKGNFAKAADYMLSYLKSVKYYRLKEFLKLCCEKMFEKKSPEMFFKILEQIKETGMELLLDDLLSKILDPMHGEFFSALFGKEAPPFFQSYKRLSDNRNILHFAAVISNEESILCLIQKYSSLLNERDRDGQLPLDLIIQRRKSDNKEFYFPMGPLRKILEKTKRINQVQAKIRLTLDGTVS